MLLEVIAKTFKELLATAVMDQLSQDRCALGVRDAIEVGSCRLDIGRIGDDWVGGDELILVIGPVL